MLHQVSVRIGAGEHVAIVAPTGSGKSTLVSLLAGIRQPRKASITLRGVPVADLDPATLHRTVALDTQETHVFTGTLSENLRLGRADATDRHLVEALTAVRAMPWVDTLPAGLDTQVGAGGHALTASQAQHLALARLLLLDPRVVVLDEATAEAGSDTARTLDFAASAALADRATLIIAHWLTQATSADTILVMDNGVITERGPHANLVAAGGHYATLWHSWTGR